MYGVFRLVFMYCVLVEPIQSALRLHWFMFQI